MDNNTHLHDGKHHREFSSFDSELNDHYWKEDKNKDRSQRPCGGFFLSAGILILRGKGLLEKFFPIGFFHKKREDLGPSLDLDSFTDTDEVQSPSGN